MHYIPAGSTAEPSRTELMLLYNTEYEISFTGNPDIEFDKFLMTQMTVYPRHSTHWKLIPALGVQLPE